MDVEEKRKLDVRFERFNKFIIPGIYFDNSDLVIEFKTAGLAFERFQKFLSGKLVGIIYPRSKTILLTKENTEEYVNSFSKD